jgi:hypothetical protein
VLREMLTNFDLDILSPEALALSLVFPLWNIRSVLPM